jgi:AcrR family transcriptional regulator
VFGGVDRGGRVAVDGLATGMDSEPLEADPVRPPPARAERVPGEKRRAQIIEAARELFVRYGYDGTRTKEIAERAGTREGVLYRHFESKEQLFDAAVLEPLTEWVASAASASAEIAEATDPQERIDALRRTNERLVEAVVGITPLLGVALFSSSERGQAFYRDHFHPLLEESFRQSERAMGGQWSKPEFDARFLMLSGIGIYLAHALDVHFRGVEVDSVRTARRYVELLSRGAMREGAVPREG